MVEGIRAIAVGIAPGASYEGESSWLLQKSQQVLTLAPPQQGSVNV